MENKASKRPGFSCTQCRTRKQKCSKEWPCTHCLSRRLPHLCDFSQQFKPASGIVETRSSTPCSESRKRGPEEAIEESQTETELAEDGLKAWGFMPSHSHYQLPAVRSEGKRSPNASEPGQASAVKSVLSTVPPRSIAVRDYLEGVNNRFNAVYGPTFTERYVQWWADRTAGKELCPEFTCLLLRVLAYALVNMSEGLRKKIEYELAGDGVDLTVRLTNAADELALSFPAATTSLARVQEKYLKACWLKSDYRMVASWHALGSAVREAQELGIDRDEGIEYLPDFELEIRRRLWTLLYAWDWQIATYTERPHHIDQAKSDFVFPNLRLDSASEQSPYSPFAHMSLQAMFSRMLSNSIGDTSKLANLSGDQIQGLEAVCEQFAAELPPVYALDAPDRSLDKAHSHYVYQRGQIHIVFYLVRLRFYRPYLTRATRNAVESSFRDKGVDIGLKLVGVCSEVHDKEIPIRTKFHIVVYAIFDTAIFLCSALIHDTEKTLRNRPEVISAIDMALRMLHQISLTTKIAASSYSFLLKINKDIPELSHGGPSQKRMKATLDPKPATSSVAPVHVGSEGSPATPALLHGDVLAPITLANSTFSDFDQFLLDDFLDSSAMLDFGSLDDTWGWDSLSLQGFFAQNQFGQV
ncbi:hypothetical protein M011DRAFT_267128 [Sporormia fimetaria CBS 119925]|uniref:Zn(2)-C6 fungal-type domain-containing protein n=1 Tax=Sporormia fimetaria CBS 119925 TaxID=1340428 RepID=A0A6A6UXG8_9PLEO|nr:hypothetical protein M011DRAFT_267128 [Sporormia fimetaria CBS 119925]